MKKFAICLAAAIFGAHAGAQTTYEVRTYTAVEGRMQDVVSRIGEQVRPLFTKHGMTSVGYWIATDKPNTLIYILSHSSKQDAKKNWDAFYADPSWHAIKKASAADGKTVEKIEIQYMDPTSFSPLH